MEAKLQAGVDALESRGWRVVINQEGTFMEWYSPAGEDICIEKEPCASAEELLKMMRTEYETFDVDEHVDLWAPMRGTKGVPGSYVVLVDDARAIEDELKQCVEALEATKEVAA